MEEIYKHLKLTGAEIEDYQLRTPSLSRNKIEALDNVVEELSNILSTLEDIEKWK